MRENGAGGSLSHSCLVMGDLFDFYCFWENWKKFLLLDTKWGYLCKATRPPHIFTEQGFTNQSPNSTRTRSWGRVANGCDRGGNAWQWVLQMWPPLLVCDQCHTALWASEDATYNSTLCCCYFENLTNFFWMNPVIFTLMNPTNFMHWIWLNQRTFSYLV